MSTITAPTSGIGNRPYSRTPYVIAAALLGVVAVGAVVGPRLTTTTGTTATTTTVNQHDAIEHRSDDARAAAAASAAAAKSLAVQQALDLQGKVVASGAALAPATGTIPQEALPQGMTRAYVGGQLETVPLPELVGKSTTNEQIGSVGHYSYVPMRMTQKYVGSQLVTTFEPVTTAPDAVTSPTVREQVGGAQPGYAYVPATTATHMRWSDRWVPPYDNPDWVPFIKAHYFQRPVTTPTTHEYR
jgi:hypothetical protein